NVRELQNVVTSLLVYSPQEKITPADLDERYIPRRKVRTLGSFNAKVDSVKRTALEDALITAGSQRGAARLLNLPYATFRDLLKRYGLLEAPRQGVHV